MRQVYIAVSSSYGCPTNSSESSIAISLARVTSGDESHRGNAQVLRGKTRRSGVACFVSSLVSWIQNECLTSAPIMMHTRPPFEQKRLILLGCGQLVDSPWISCG